MSYQHDYNPIMKSYRPYIPEPVDKTIEKQAPTHNFLVP